MRIRPTVNDSATPTEVSVIDADKVGGFEASMTPGASQIPVKDGNNNLNIPSGKVLIGNPTDNSKTVQVKGTCSIGETSGYEPLVLRRDIQGTEKGVLLQFQTKNDAGEYFTSAALTGLSGDVSAGNESGSLYCTVPVAGVLQTVLILSDTGGYFAGDVSAATFTDRTPFFEGDALSEVKKIKGKDGEIDHKSLPAFAYTKKIKIDEEGIEKEEEGRDIGAMLSVLTVAVQQLLERIEDLEKKGK